MSPAPTPRVSAAHAQRLKIPAAPKTLTPKRKHRKMLKDGTSEVWPEDVEAIFVEGLRQYWNSPWATFSSGRSRWRNAYLVEFLQKAEIIRTKKQVASHIQVLRNMWKGEPEYCLVAGADDEVPKAQSASGATDDDDSDSRSAGSASSPLTPASLNSMDDPFTSYHRNSHGGQLGLSGVGSHRTQSAHAAISIKTEELGTDRFGSSFSPSYPANYGRPRSYPSAVPSVSSPLSSPGVVLSPDTIFTSNYHTVSVAEQRDNYTPIEDPTRSSSLSSGTSHAGPSTPQSSLNNRVVGFSIWSAGMSVCSVATETIRQHDRMAVRVQLHTPVTSGAVPVIALSAPWHRDAICVTEVCLDGQVHQEQCMLIASPPTIPGSALVACLPDPWAIYCRYYPYSTSSVPQISHKVYVDDVALSAVYFDLTADAPAPGISAAITSVQGYAADGSPRWSPTPIPPPTLSADLIPPAPTGSTAYTALRTMGAPTPVQQHSLPSSAFHGHQPALIQTSIPVIRGSTAFGPYC